MLNIFSSLETAAGARGDSGLGACLPGHVGTVDPSSTGVMARPRPRAGVHGRTGAFQGTSAGQSQPFGLQSNCEKYAHTTRIAAASGGASGPHPARDPV